MKYQRKTPPQPIREIGRQRLAAALSVTAVTKRDDGTFWVGEKQVYPIKHVEWYYEDGTPVK